MAVLGDVMSVSVCVLAATVVDGGVVVVSVSGSTFVVAVGDTDLSFVGVWVVTLFDWAYCTVD